MNYNFPEILMVNGVGAVLIILVYLSKIKYHKTESQGEKLFDFMLFVSMTATVAEAISFLIDGKDFFLCRFLLLLINAQCVGSTLIVGYCWCLYTDFRIHRNWLYVRKNAVALGIPFVIIMLMLLADLFGAKLLFEITPENIYVRGKYCPLVYLLLFAYYSYSVVATYRSWKKEPHVEFFPVLYFIIPCVAGTIIQGLFYGITIGWTMVDIAMVFVHLNLQSENAFIDDLSGLYNRNYLRHILDLHQRKHYGNVYGIMMDINDFKQINDTFGHAAGDSAIRAMGSLLLESVPTRSVVLRMGGDEFIVLLVDSSWEETEAVVGQIRNRVAKFNESGQMPYTLSLAIGSAYYSGGSSDAFFSNMDKVMYASKKAHYRP